MSGKDSGHGMYKDIGGDFYYNQTVSKNPVRRWFHTTRYLISNSLVKSKYKKGSKIVDLGCGSCDWNVDRLDVFGIDVNEELLKAARDNNRVYDYAIADASDTKLPSGSFDIATSFDCLEHIADPGSVVSEAYRLLKTGGYYIVSVPFDVLFSLWRPLFFLQVIFHGYILGNPYYKSRCGHIHHFSPGTIKKLLTKQGY